MSIRVDKAPPAQLQYGLCDAIKTALPQHREPLALTIKPSRLLVSILTDTVPAQSFCAEISLSFLSSFVGWRCVFAPSIVMALLPPCGADLRFTKETNDF
jgi:hypothetical protein